MFNPRQRAQLRSDLLARASHDPRIGGAAITGSAADGREDDWSDIDLAFGVRDAAGLQPVLSDWTAYMYGEPEALDHVDVNHGAWVYRVFLLANTLQVDLAFAPAAEFRALAPTFRLVFGEAKEPRHTPSQAPSQLIGLGWLYALHARSSIARRKVWQAEYMISTVRDHALALACLRHDLPSTQARGIDRLPAEVAAQFEPALVRQLDQSELWRAFQAATRELLKEIYIADAGLAARLEKTLMRLCQPTA